MRVKVLVRGGFGRAAGNDTFVREDAERAVLLPGAGALLEKCLRLVVIYNYKWKICNYYTVEIVI